MENRDSDWESRTVDSVPDLAIDLLCDLQHVTDLWMSVSSAVQGGAGTCSQRPPSAQSSVILCFLKLDWFTNRQSLEPLSDHKTNKNHDGIQPPRQGL